MDRIYLSPGGLCDPGAACLYPHAALGLFHMRRIVIIERPAKDSRRALEKFAGGVAAKWGEIEKRYNFFRESVKAPIIVQFKDLADFGVVSSLCLELTGQKLSRERFNLFDGLHIEQDIVKRAKQEAA